MKCSRSRTVFLNFLHYTALYASRPYLSLLAQEMGGSEIEIGFIVSLYSFIQVATALLVGYWIDKSGIKRPSCCGSICFFCGTSILMFTSCLRQVGIGSLFMGIGHGIILLCGQHSVTSVPDDTARTAAVGWLSFFNSVGTAAGPLIGGKLRDLYGLHYGFSGAVLLSFGAILAAFSMPSTQVKATIHSRAPLRIKKPLVLDIILSGTVFFVADVISVYLPLYTYQMALSGILTGTILSANGVAQMIVRPFMGYLRKWFSVRRLLQSCLLIGGICIALIGCSSTFKILLLTSILAGCALGLANPLTLLTVSSSAKSSERSQILSLRVVANYSAQALSPIIFGSLSAVAGLSPVLWCAGGILFCAGMTMQCIENK